MDTNTLPYAASYFFAQPDELAQKPTFEKVDDNGKKVLRVLNIPIFRSGQFKDSMGDLFSFDKFGIDSFMRNFGHLKDTGIFTMPPVRAGHPHPFNNGRMESVIGYITDIRVETRTAPHDNQEYDYLLADLDILRSDAQENIESGLWFNRSIEIGPYEDNSGQEYAPVVLGVAYVDIPAVEGLNFNKNQEGNTMGGVIMPNVNGGKAADFTFKIGGNDTNDFSRVQGYITETETKLADITGKFQASETKIANLTAENTSLKEFQSTVKADIRKDFVNSLATDNKILESAKESTAAFAADLTDAQFDAWKKTWDNAPKAAPLGTFGHQNAEGKDGHDNGADANDSKSVALAADKGVLNDFKMLGKSEEVIKKTPAYQRVIAAEPNFVL